MSHRNTPHFKRYVDGTTHMIKARMLVDMIPVQLSTKDR